jgi:hypothetical protein
MQLARIPRLAPVAGIGGGGDCELVAVRGKRVKSAHAGKAARAGARQVLRCRPGDAAPAGSRATAKAGGKAGAKASTKAGGKGKASARSAGKSSAKAAGKPAKPHAGKAKH